jgi:hypothetical protein
VSLCLLCECRQIRRGKQKWEKKTNLLIHRHATRILCCYGIDENGGEDYGRAGAVLEDAVDQVRDVGSCIRYSSSLIAIIRTGTRYGLALSLEKVIGYKLNRGGLELICQDKVETYSSICQPRNLRDDET